MTPIPLSCKDNAQGQLDSGINASVLSIPLKSGHGANFPQPYTGSATSAGDGTTLNSTGISAAIGGSACEGKLIWNKTDGSVAVIVSVATDAVTTTRLIGGSDNTWGNSDVWCIDPFVATSTKVSSGTITQYEEMLILARSTDTLTVASDGRGYNGTTANTFAADDYVNIFTTAPLIERLKDIVTELAKQNDTNVTSIAAILSDLASTADGKGANMIVVEDAEGDFAGDTVEEVLHELKDTMGNGSINVESKTTEYNISATTDLSKLFTNKGATTRVDCVLPSASAGYNHEFAVQAAQYLVVRQASGDTIRNGSTVTTDTTPGFYSNTIGNTLRAVALDSDAWFIQSLVGTWTALVLKGYYMGGNNGSVYSTAIDDLNFSAETSAAISATLDTGRGSGAGVSGRIKGYAMGGDSGSARDLIDDLTFIAETSAAISATLDTARYMGTGVQSSTKGYCMGGYTTSTAIDDITFATETSAALSAVLPTGKRAAAGVSSSTKGYAIGGNTGSRTTGIAALTFSGESCSAISATLSVARDGLSNGGGQSSTKGYTFGGSTGSASNVIDALVFSGETNGSISTTLGTARSLCGVTSAPAKCYIMGGTATVTSIEAFVFSGETISTLSATLDAGRGEGATVSAS